MFTSGFAFLFVQLCSTFAFGIDFRGVEHDGGSACMHGHIVVRRTLLGGNFHGCGVPGWLFQNAAQCVRALFLFRRHPGFSQHLFLGLAGWRFSSRAVATAELVDAHHDQPDHR